MPPSEPTPRPYWLKSNAAISGMPNVSGRGPNQATSNLRETYTLSVVRGARRGSAGSPVTKTDGKVGPLPGQKFDPKDPTLAAMLANPRSTVAEPLIYQGDPKGTFLAPVRSKGQVIGYALTGGPLGWTTPRSRRWASCANCASKKVYQCRISPS